MFDSTIFFTDNFQFQALFRDHLTIAFNAWGAIQPKVTEKLAHKQYDFLTADIQNLMESTTKKCGDDLIGFMGKSDFKILDKSGWNNELWQKVDAKSSAKNKLFLIGEIFVQIHWIWQFISNNKDTQLSRKQLNEFFMRTDTLRALVDNLALVCMNGESGKIGGEKKNPVREQCKVIIQSPEYNIRPSDARARLADTIQKIKDIYFDLYKEPLQKPNQKGGISPSDKTITNWFYEFSINHLPGKRA